MEAAAAAAAAARPAAAAAVYGLAGALGSELQRLSRVVGPGAVAGLVAQVVHLLELLEALAGAGQRSGAEPRGASSSSSDGQPGPAPARDAAQVTEQELAEVQERDSRLRSRLAQLEEENRGLVAQLADSQAQADSTWSKEREVMLRLKEVVDKQRDEIRVQARDILCRAQDAEALQEQLSRFMSMNEELRRKLAVVQAQLRSALDKKEELENLLLEARREAEGLRRAVAATEPSRTDVTEGTEVVATSGRGLPGRGSFSREELQQILQERNELKTSLFLVQEELAYYQRELLNDQRIPSILLHAVKSTIKKQRKKIRAKMLGTVEDSESSGEEEWLTAPPDSVDGHLPGSRIRSFFGLWYRGSSKSSSPGAGSGAWEIVSPQDVCPAEEEQQTASCSSGSPSKASSLA